MRYTLHLVLFGALVLMPLSARAATAAELQAQAQALLDQISALQAQAGAGASAGGGVGSGACPSLGRSLKLGASGSDVAQLQQFLAADTSVYPEGLVTGYFGVFTQAAVQRWQVRYGVVSSGTPSTTGYGVVGPRTAAAIRAQCIGGTSGPPVGGFIQVTPTVGNAPLSVTVQATVNTVNSCAATTYNLSYGDGTISSQIVVPAGSCRQLSQIFGHRYVYGGTYLITLSSGAHSISATVVASGVGAPSPSYTASSPSPSSSYSYGPLSISPGVGGNALVASAQFDIPTPCTAYDLSWGDGSADVSQSDSGSVCAQTVTTQSFTHQYASAGVYTITLKRGAGLSQTDTASINISSY